MYVMFFPRYCIEPRVQYNTDVYYSLFRTLHFDKFIYVPILPLLFTSMMSNIVLKHVVGNYNVIFFQFQLLLIIRYKKGLANTNTIK